LQLLGGGGGGGGLLANAELATSSADIVRTAAKPNVITLFM
jgi:hypothetical protein